MGSSTNHQNLKNIHQTQTSIFVAPKMTANQQLSARISQQSLISADKQKSETMKFNHKIGTDKNLKDVKNGTYDRMIELMEQKEILLIY